MIDAMNWSRGGQVPFGVFDSVALSEEEAGAVMEDENVRRAISEAVSEAKRGR